MYYGEMVFWVYFAQLVLAFIGGSIFIYLQAPGFLVALGAWALPWAVTQLVVRFLLRRSRAVHASDGEK